LGPSSSTEFAFYWIVLLVCFGFSCFCWILEYWASI
jgi:preprotein translocase subunit SecE